MLLYIRYVYFSWHSLSYFLPHDVAHYQLLTDTCQQQKHIETAQIYCCDWNVKQDFIMKYAMRNVDRSNEKVERFPVILAMSRTTEVMNLPFFFLFFKKSETLLDCVLVESTSVRASVQQ